MDAITDSSAERLLQRAGMQRLPSPKAEIFQCRDFAPAELRAALITLIDRDRRPSTIADDNGDQYFRTSETCDLAHDEPAVRQLEGMLGDLSGINPAHGEPPSASTPRYRPSVTFYLNDVDAGGATRFKAVGKTFQPEAGKLVCWNNRRLDGRENPNTLHHGMKVRKGTKYVITKWYRERPWG